MEILWYFESILAGLCSLLTNRHGMLVPDVNSISSGQLVLLFVQSCPSPLKTWLLTDLDTFSRAVTRQIQLTQSHPLDSRSMTVEQPRRWPGVVPEWWQAACSSHHAVARLPGVPGCLPTDGYYREYPKEGESCHALPVHHRLRSNSHWPQCCLMVLIRKHASFCSFMRSSDTHWVSTKCQAGNELNELDHLAVKE